MQRLAELCIRLPVFASMIVLSLVVIGAASYFQLDIDKHPEVELPTVSMRTNLPGASPEEVEVSITQVIEEAVNTVEGITELRSNSGQGTSNVIVTFNLNRDIETATQDIRDRVATIGPAASAGCPAAGRSRNSTATNRRPCRSRLSAIGRCAS